MQELEKVGRGQRRLDAENWWGQGSSYAEAPQEEEEEEETGSYINPVGTAQKHITSDPANEFSANEFSANEDLFCCFSNSANEYGFG